jgi:uncharacterized protein YgiM (DUF1202 family)
MFLPRRHGAIARSLLIAGCIGLAGIASPASTMASTDVATGTDAVVADAQGDNVRIRADASYNAEIVTKVPEGTALTVIEGPLADDGGTLWYRVSSGDATGYMDGTYVDTDPGSAPVTNTGAGGTATATDNVHLRSGPSLAYVAIDKIMAGDTVTLSGEFTNGWIRVTWNGYEGWVDGAYLAPNGDAPPTDSPATETPATETPATETPVAETPDTDAGDVDTIEPGTRYTNDSVNLRTEPALDSTIRKVLPAGVAVEMTGEVQDGFAKGTANGDLGWVSVEFLVDATPVAPEGDQGLSDEPETTEPPAETPTPAPQETPTPEPSGSTIVWPVKGGDWYIGQGYNGSSHQNESSLWQYQYSFDLARTDENTGGQTVYSPVNGTVRWLDPSTGGISIDVGDGLAVALFHVDIDGSVTEGDQLTQGQVIGVASQPGGGGNGGWSHVHITAWRTTDGGNWSREAIPFEGIAAISGQNFPNDGSSQDWTGTTFTP